MENFNQLVSPVRVYLGIRINETSKLMLQCKIDNTQRKDKVTFGIRIIQIKSKRKKY
jgi:hypothetical protein